ncbi:MAG: endolytic transglycosylase MltG [Mycobacterium sp.]
MSDDSPRSRAEPVAVGPTRQRKSRAERIRVERRRRQYRRRRRIVGGTGAVLLTAIALAAIFIGSRLWHGASGPVTDYRGEGKRELIVEVKLGDSTTTIGETLQKQGVIATVPVFLEAARDSTEIASIQPGFYLLRNEIPAAAAVQQLTDPESRVGKLVIPEGRQLDDITDMKTAGVTPGVLTLIEQASCVELNGDRHCVATDDLRRAAQTATPAALAVPDWAGPAVLRMGNDHRRIEGLITAGAWNVNPAGSAQDILAVLIGGSAAEMAKAGLPSTAEPLHMSPYELLVVASLVQREALPQDFAKVSRVIYNRLAESQRLEFDSTVNYPLDRQEVATTDADRAKETPWNTYAGDGLPATPICSPGTDALEAAEHPEPGDWLYFVTIDKQGTTLFTHSYQQHLTNIKLALHNGVLDSSR